MERFFERDFVMNTLLPAVVLLAVAFAMIVVVFGMENVVAGVHDMFHDFRHTIGMPCH